MLGDVKIAPSILSADFMHLADELDSIASADYIHFDVMDGSFVPNLSFGLPILKQVKAASSLPVDVHLMISNPDTMVENYLAAGADIVCFHQEAAIHAHRLVAQIHDAGAKAGIALNPATPVSTLEAIVGDLDLVLVMSVNPGFGGQSFIGSTYRKLEALKALCERVGAHPIVEVDGGVGPANAEKICAAGATMLVAGSAVFNGDPAQSIAALREAGRAGLSRKA